jgi:hypothetical protein
LLTGEITRLARDREGFFRLSEGNSAVRHVYDKGSFYGIVDIVNPWDYSLTMDGIDAFICDNVFVPDNEPFDEIHGHEMESAYRAQRASHK